jgi:hypothetical protein
MGLNTRPPGRREAPPAPFSVAGGRLWAGRQGQRPNSQTSKQTCGTQSGMRRNYCALRYLSPGLRHFHVRAPQHAEHSQKAPTQIEQLQSMAASATPCTMSMAKSAQANRSFSMSPRFVSRRRPFCEGGQTHGLLFSCSFIPRLPFQV